MNSLRVPMGFLHYSLAAMCCLRLQQKLSTRTKHSFISWVLYTVLGKVGWQPQTMGLASILSKRLCTGMVIMIEPLLQFHVEVIHALHSCPHLTLSYSLICIDYYFLAVLNIDQCVLQNYLHLWILTF